jgi:rhodanese-related sulfurtransferase
VKSRTVPVILYDTDKSRLERVKDFLESNFNIKRIYLCQIKEQEIARFVSKVNDTSLFFREPYYDSLISPDALNAVIRPVRVDQTLKISPLLDYKLFDVSNDELKYHYDIQHIPSAVHLSTDDLESKPLWNRKSTNELAKLLLSYGVKPNNSEMIILYGNPDPMGSFRAAIILKSMGVNNVRVLNGGYQSWY